MDWQERVVVEADLLEAVEAVEEVLGEGGEGVVVEVGVAEGRHAAEGGERAGERVGLEAEVLQHVEGGEGGGQGADEADALEVEVVDPAHRGRRRRGRGPGGRGSRDGAPLAGHHATPLALLPLLNREEQQEPRLCVRGQKRRSGW